MASPRVTLQLCSCGRGAPPTTTRTKERGTAPARPRVVASAPDSHAMAHTSQSRPPQEPGMPLHLVTAKPASRGPAVPLVPRGPPWGGGRCCTQHLCRQDARHVASTLPPSSFVQCGSGAGRLAGASAAGRGGSSSPGPTDTPSPRGHSHRGERTWHRAEGRQRKPGAPGAKAERSSQLRWASKQKGVVSGRTRAGEGAGWTLEAGDHVGTVGSCRRQLVTRPPLPPW